MAVFKKAQRTKAKIKLALAGPSGSGKTYSALRFFKGFGGKTALIDTENGSASLYDDNFEFDVVDLNPPYTSERFLEYIQAAIDEGYENLIIDSLSHAWAGAGGIVERKNDYDLHKGGNSFANWSSFSKEHEAFIAKILHAPINIIATMRTKTEYSIDPTQSGKTTVRKLGTKPIQRDGVEYEFTSVLDVQMDHKVKASKDRTKIFGDSIIQLTEETGKKFRDWISKAKEVESYEDEEKKSYITKLNELRAKINDSDKKVKIDNEINNATCIKDLKSIQRRLEKTISLQ